MNQKLASKVSAAEVIVEVAICTGVF